MALYYTPRRCRNCNGNMSNEDVDDVSWPDFIFFMAAHASLILLATIKQTVVPQFLPDYNGILAWQPAAMVLCTAALPILLLILPGWISRRAAQYALSMTLAMHLLFRLNTIVVCGFPEQSDSNVLGVCLEMPPGMGLLLFVPLAYVLCHISFKVYQGSPDARKTMDGVLNFQPAVMGSAVSLAAARWIICQLQGSDSSMSGVWEMGAIGFVGLEWLAVIKSAVLLHPMHCKSSENGDVLGKAEEIKSDRTVPSDEKDDSKEWDFVDQV